MGRGPLWLWLTPARSTAATGAWPSPTTTTSACLGVHDGDHGRFRRSSENCRFAGEKAAGSGVRALWGQQWTRLPFFLLIPGSTATTGAWPSPLSRGGWLGVQQRDDGPLERCPEMAALQGKSGRVRGPRPLGAGMDSSAFFRAAKSAATTGAFAATFGSEAIIVPLHPILVAANRMVKP